MPYKKEDIAMKNYTITVNGNIYDVTVEEVTSKDTSSAAPKAAPVVVAKQSAAPLTSTPKTHGTGAIKIEAGSAGKVFRIEAGVGQVVKKGEAIIVIEAMKMEIPIVAPEDATVASIDVAVGDAIEAGAILATLN